MEKVQTVLIQDGKRKRLINLSEFDDKKHKVAKSEEAPAAPQAPAPVPAPAAPQAPAPVPAPAAPVAYTVQKTEDGKWVIADANGKQYDETTYKTKKDATDMLKLIKDQSKGE